MANTEIAARRLALCAVLVVIGIYLLISGITRKGMLYHNPSLHNSNKYDSYVKMVRTFCFVLPCIFAVSFILSLLSFAQEYNLSELAKINDVQGYNAAFPQAKFMYNLTTGGLVTSIAGVVVMLGCVAFFTAKYSGKNDSEKLSGDHPAFRK